ncbi:unnamed protein product [Heligmosomoides polygyrus]|uniref:Uncharacterized protein n=1 Tax=Heligmosomoides polygyrus TaxID=6339 RepID=A0A3P8IA85_HELPZ|nr:unnamed protein product [Heligmosomoides polygyrus]
MGVRFSSLQMQCFQINRERDESPFSSSRSVFEMLERLQQPTTTTTPQPPLLERLLRPYIEPWQKQFDDFSKDVAGITMLPSTTTAPRTTTYSSQNLLEKSLRMFFPSFAKEKQPTTTTPLPKLFDANLLEKLFFSRTKRDAAAFPPLLPTADMLNPFRQLEKPILDLANPFTPNPLMSLFTTKAPIALEPLMPEPQFKLQDPFYNPLFPNRKSKLFDMLAGGEAGRFFG